MNTEKLILVTGSAGFIGSNLCHYLLDKGYQVRGLDNFATGKRKNIEELELRDGFTFTEGDIRDLDTCQRSCKGVSVVLHQAALGSVPRSIKDPITTNAVNIDGFLNILVAARDQGVDRVVYAASSSTYGDSKALPKVEDQIGKPLSPYAITKYVNELYADIFQKAYGLNTIGLRYFNVFGRRQDPEGAYAAVIPKFVMKFMKHESPVINGDGTYSRDFTYIDNVLLANYLAMETTSEQAINQVYNVAYGERTTLLELCELLKQELGVLDPEILKVPVLHGPLREGDIPHSLASIDKARTLLGYDPGHNMAAGIKEAVKWYWEHLDKP